MRPTVMRLRRVARASERVLLCVAPRGVVSNVVTTTCSTWSSVTRCAVCPAVARRDIEASPVARPLLEAIDVLRSDKAQRARPASCGRTRNGAGGCASSPIRASGRRRCCSSCATRSAPATSGWHGHAATAISGGRCCRFPPSRMPTTACRYRPVRTSSAVSGGIPASPKGRREPETAALGAAAPRRLGAAERTNHGRGLGAEDNGSSALCPPAGGRTPEPRFAAYGPRSGSKLREGYPKPRAYAPESPGDRPACHRRGARRRVQNTGSRSLRGSLEPASRADGRQRAV